MMFKSPGLTAVAVVALALGIGATTAIFSVVHAIMLRPLPYSEPEQLVTVWEESEQLGMSEIPIAYPNFRDWQEQNTVFDQVAVYSFSGFNLAGEGEPEYVFGVRASASLFPLLGVSPALGRTFTADEDKAGAAPTVILSHALWLRRFHSDRDVVGKSVTLDKRSYTIAGVMPEGFEFPVGFTFKGKALNDPIELYVPAGPTGAKQERGSHSFLGIARLKQGVSLKRAQAEMETIARRIEQDNPDSMEGLGVRLVPAHEQMVANVRPMLWVLLGAVAFVLLIACANVANLLLARATSRQKEIAIRTAIGASRRRIVRQLLTESVVLALMGGAAGLLLALWGTDALIRMSPDNIPRVRDIRVDSGVLLFTLGVSLVTGIVFGLAPAFGASRPDLNETLKEGARGSNVSPARARTRSLLVAAEIALSLVLLVSAGLMIKSFVRLQRVSPGFNADNVLTMRLSLPATKYGEPAEQVRFYDETLRRIKELPGVRAVGLTSVLPMGGNISETDFFIEGRPDPAPGDALFAGNHSVSPDYFRAMGIALTRGRDFAETDTNKAPLVAIINETMARTYFDGEDPVGKHISFDEPDQGHWITIVGVVADVKQFGLDAETRPVIYAPFAQAPVPGFTLAVRTTSAPEALANSIKGEILAIDKDQALADVRPMSALVSDSLSRQRFSMVLFAIFAGVALVLASVGIYGVMSYTVTQRTHEIGIRMALGASSSSVLKLIVRQGMAVALAGVVAGLGASYVWSRLIESLLYDVSATDTVTFVIIPLMLAAVALAACLVPARRAARVDPMIALRHE